MPHCSEGAESWCVWELDASKEWKGDLSWSATQSDLPVDLDTEAIVPLFIHSLCFTINSI